MCFSTAASPYGWRNQAEVLTKSVKLLKGKKDYSSVLCKREMPAIDNTCFKGFLYEAIAFQIIH